MRPLRIDITGTTDAKGNASIPIRLPFTGEWHIAKINLSTTGPAEWAIVVSGSVATYGRGRRVTLGPELIQDGETVSVTVTGGPTNAAVSGTVNGISGAPEQMLAAYTPQPNTIALDTTQQIPLLVAPVSVLSGNNVNLPPLPAGTTYLSVFYKPSNPTTAEIIGLSLPAYTYYLESVPGSAPGILRYVKVDPAMDTSLRFNNNGPGTINNLEIAAHFDAHPPMDTVGNVVVDVASTSAAPALWQAPGAYASLVQTTQNTFILVAGQPGQIIRVFSGTIQLDGGPGLQLASLSDGNDGNTSRIVMASVNVSGTIPFSFPGGVPLTSGNALNFTTFQANNARVTVAYSQG